jgi:hypothetical protein
MSATKYREADTAMVAARLAAQYLTSAAATRLTRQMLDYYCGCARVSVDVWEQDDGPTAGYRISVEVHFTQPSRSLAGERRRVLEIVKATTDRSPFILDHLDDGVRAVVAIPFQHGEAAVAEYAARRAAGTMDRVH